ncbi:MAG: ABC transporter permease [Clostridia bacterium]|nr:ABC transporter permease [Clostridia bacterium]
MKPLKRLCLWYALLTKRILKQKAFLAILLLIPLMACAMRLMPPHDGGIVSVAVAKLGDDSFSSDTVARLTEGKSVIKYTLCETEDEAVKAVKSGQCDAAWIFLEDAGLQAAKFAAGRSTDGAVKIIEREKSVTLSIARERLFIAMFPYISYGAYSDFLNDMSPEGTVTEAELNKYYDANIKKTGLIEYYYVDGTRQMTSDILTAPVRGLLALIIMLAALASCMYACREEHRGVFEHLKGKKRAFIPLLCHITAVVPTAVASLAALYLSGLWTGLQRELLTMTMYILSVAAFCEILRLLCRSEVTLGAIIPVLVTLMLVLCPIFLHIDNLHILQYSLPPFYYLNSVLNGAFIHKFAVYDIAVCIIASAAALGNLIRQK